MRLLTRRTGHDPDTDLDRLQPSFPAQLDPWHDVVRPLHDVLDAVTPLADLEETDTGYLLDVELPGVRPADVDLQVTEDRLVLRAVRRERERVGLLRHRTRTTGHLAVSVDLPGPVDTAGVTADLEHGVLHVVAPKAAHARRRRVALTHR